MIKVGEHLLTHGNITGGQLQALLSSLPDKVDFCYTDPPWGNSNLTYWKTINRKMTGSETDQIDQNELENIVVNCICDYVENYAFIVYGIRQAESIIALLKQKSNVVDIQYIPKKYGGFENCVIAVTLNNAPIIDWKSKLSYQNGLKGLNVVCNEFKGKYKSCLDMFIGIGYYLKKLDRAGFAVYGNELNEARLNKAISKVS